MILQQTPYTNMFAIISLISILLGLYIWRRFRVPEATIGMLLILASVEWMLASVFQLGSIDLPTKLFWNKLKYIGMVIQPPLWVIFTLYYTEHEKKVTPRNIVFLSCIPAATLILTFTNGMHGFIWSRITLEVKDTFLVLYHTYGVWFWISIVYTYVLIFFGSFLLILMFVRYRTLYRWQSGVLLAGALLPLFWSMLYLLEVNLYSYLEPMPLNLPVMNLALVFVLLYVKMAKIVPVARELVIEGMSDSVIVLDSEDRIVDMNAAAQRLMNAASNFIGQPIKDVWTDWGTWVNLPRDQTEMGKEIVLDQKGEQRAYDLRVSPLTSWQGYLVSRVVVIRDITARKRGEEEIRKFKTISDRAGYGSAMCDIEGTLIYINESFAQMHGYTAEELMGKHISVLHNEAQMKDVNALHEKLMERGDYTAEELWHKRKDNTVFPTLMNGTLIQNEEGIPHFVAITAVNITERKQAEDRIKQQLEEKEVLLREIHHRVKNNLQIVSSLLSLQSRYIKDKRDLEMLKESQNRIRSMALIHEKLYYSENLANIDSREYIQTLVHSLFQSYGVSMSRISLQLNVEDVSLDIDTAIPCGLIINELVSNSLKHAFPERKGEICVGLHTVNGDIELVVSDNGIGIPEDVDFSDTQSLGLHLVSVLAEGQLRGEITLSRTKGTEFRITFSEPT